MPATGGKPRRADRVRRHHDTDTPPISDTCGTPSLPPPSGSRSPAGSGKRPTVRRLFRRMRQRPIILPATPQWDCAFHDRLPRRTRTAGTPRRLRRCDAMTRVLPAINDALSPPDLRPDRPEARGRQRRQPAVSQPDPTGAQRPIIPLATRWRDRPPRSVVRTIATLSTACHTRRVTRPPRRQRAGDQRRSQQYRLRASPVQAHDWWRDVPPLRSRYDGRRTFPDRLLRRPRTIAAP